MSRSYYELQHTYPNTDSLGGVGWTTVLKSNGLTAKYDNITEARAALSAAQEGSPLRWRLTRVEEIRTPV